MPYRNMTHLDTMQTFISMQSLDSFFESYLDVLGGQGWFNETALPQPLDFGLNTQDLNIMLPGMVSTFGKNRQVKLEYEVLYFGDFRSKYAKDYMIASSTVNVRFWVEMEDGHEELAVDLNLYNITNKIALTVDPEFNLRASLREFRLHGVEVAHSAIGLLNPNTIRLKLNTVNSVVTTLANLMLEHFSVPIPRNIAGLFELDNLNIEYFDGYIYAGATPLFKPQPFDFQQLIEKPVRSAISPAGFNFLQ